MFELMRETREALDGLLNISGMAEVSGQAIADVSLLTQSREGDLGQDTLVQSGWVAEYKGGFWVFKLLGEEDVPDVEVEQRARKVRRRGVRC